MDNKTNLQTVQFCTVILMLELAVHEITIILLGFFGRRGRKIKKKRRKKEKKEKYLRHMVLGLKFRTMSHLVQKW